MQHSRRNLRSHTGYHQHVQYINATVHSAEESTVAVPQSVRQISPLHPDFNQSILLTSPLFTTSLPLHMGLQTMEPTACAPPQTGTNGPQSLVEGPGTVGSIPVTARGHSMAASQGGVVLGSPPWCCPHASDTQVPLIDEHTRNIEITATAGIFPGRLCDPSPADSG